MKVAIIGSRNLYIDNLDKYIPEDTDEIVSGGAVGIDTCAKEFALKNNIKLTEFSLNIINIKNTHHSNVTSK